MKDLCRACGKPPPAEWCWAANPMCPMKVGLRGESQREAEMRHILQEVELIAVGMKMTVEEHETPSEALFIYATLQLCKALGLDPPK